MKQLTVATGLLTPEVCARALEARDPRFDGVFFVGITSTRIYCRPICPARVSRPDNRRFFDSPASAERAGFRPCRRCRPELAPGRALIDAVSRLAQCAARRIAAGALNGRPVKELARELFVSERHLRRALERELGVSPVELAQTHRLLLAKRLLTDTGLSVSRVAYASGFQSLRRFNSAFREHYKMNPTVLRRQPLGTGPRRDPANRTAPDEMLRLTLAYRAPFAWEVLLGFFRRDQLPGVELVEGARYTRTVQIEGRRGLIVAENGSSRSRHRDSERSRSLNVSISPSLLPVLMPLLARLRQMFDLDAEPTVVDGCLDGAGLGELVRQRPGVRIPGTIHGFDAGLGMLLRDQAPAAASHGGAAHRVLHDLGEPIETGIRSLDRLSPDPGRVAEAGIDRMVALGIHAARAETIVAFACAVADGGVCLDPGSDADGTREALLALPHFDEQLATMLVIRTVGWPDAFTASDPDLLRAAEADSPQVLHRRAEQWRPWRAYAFLHLCLRAGNGDGTAHGSRPHQP
jgi:AraC family transcriptional regulator, regulatory protein of adaptative response / DNA-3-methyladenine glycosylase II